MAILDRANAFIGHEQEVDEGYETTMRRRAFIAGFKEALGLVRGMREAQKQWKDGDPFDGTEVELAKRMCESERKVDEYLKKMENNDRRKALEAENTEFDYGHNVKHYSED